MGNDKPTTQSDDSVPLTDKVAANMLAELFKTNRWQKLFNAVAIFGIVIVLAASVFLIESHVELKNDEAKLQSNAVSSCQNGNAFRSGQTDIWKEYYALQAQESKATAQLLVDLVNAVAQHNPVVVSQIDSILKQSDTDQAAETKEFLAKVASVNATRDCVQANKTSTSADGS
jgi:hypothetical protein